ncbi:hypothetical protein EGY07_03885 [Chryseobacterium indologenes]|uniref:Uncharacterized protein n=1 Tax=Chryseobacterium indologenes TaxID=253 RepID=A0AAD0YVF4_CHRID|nr:hypothetical protein CEQ15_12805 [Chryseobacterium indologenes]GAE64840.1 hypothetical protein CIN01S_09_03250 [Chryseobacterium indologenes NBRC 14944]AYZ34769.1 hypothetical protein EGY07_03885 [Chryseobacterium indologenes]AZB18020.1 hypothetical protein EG352_09670 [Chryseobacterium indologenes]SFJ89279.1 hypothetical protein SAMN05421692_2867 [Chryseobacterium indologenes]
MTVSGFNIFTRLAGEFQDSPEMIIFGAFFLPLVLLIPVTVAGWVFRKLKFNMYIVHVLLYTLLFTFILGVVTIFVLFLVTDKNIIKLMYCWLTIFTGMFFFSLINANTITKMFSDWSKIIKEKEKK